jgi:4-aminobutyrate aminotransferase-like enzyme
MIPDAADLDLGGDLLPLLVCAPAGPASRSWLDRLSAVECPAITHRRRSRAATGAGDPIVWAAARGCNVWDADGNRFVDLTAGFAVSAVGHGHPRVREAARAQADVLLHGMGDLFPTTRKVELGEALAAIAPGSLQQSILGLSGSDAVEAAVKTALLATGRSRVLAFRGSYHGMSLGALGLSGHRSGFRAPFSRWAGAVELRLPYAHCAQCVLSLKPSSCGLACVGLIDRLLDAELGGAEDVAAVVVEPMQGRGGIVVPPAGWLSALRSWCTRRGVLLIADEIYTGLGRTGRWWGSDHDGVEPDILCCGKALGGGFPISACLARPEIMEAWGQSAGEAIHTQTFLGHPLACATALATLRVLQEEGLVERAAALEPGWRQDLAQVCARHPWLGAPRGRGMMWGLPMQRSDGAPWAGGSVVLAGALMSRGWLVGPGGGHGEVLTLTPPLTLSDAQWRGFLEALDEAAASLMVPD